MGAVALLAALLLTSAAPAVAEAEPSRDSGTASAMIGNEAVALFLRTCGRFPGDPTGLRDWAKQAGVQEMPAGKSAVFLAGLRGTVYEVHTSDGPVVLVSEDIGSCSVYANRAAVNDVIAALEAGLRLASITFQVRDDPDPVTPDLENRDYTVSSGDKHWHMLVSTEKGQTRGDVMMTTNP